MRDLPAWLVVACLLSCGCGRKPEPLRLHRGARLPQPPRPDPRPEPVPEPLDRRASFAFDGVPLPKVIQHLAREHGLVVGVSKQIPARQWGQRKVTLCMADVRVRDFLDWLVRPVGAEYALDGHGGAWLTRGDELLLEEPLVVRSYRVPTHVRTARPVRGALSFVKEQRLIIATAEACLRYLLDHRDGCRLAFHGEQDILVARLPGPGHRRLEALLDAMRHGTEPPGLPRPALHQLQASLKVPVQCDGAAGPIEEALARIAERAKVNLGWDAPHLGSPRVALPPGERPLREVLRAVLRQTELSRYGLEPGHGIWLYLDGQKDDFPESGATVWDRAIVRAHDIRPLLTQSRPETILKRLRKQVDPGQWARGLPAAAIFTPTARLIVVHDAPGQRRVASVVQDMLQQALQPPTEPGRR